MHKALLILVFFVFVCSSKSVGQAKGNAYIVLRSGELVEGQVRFRENIYLKEIPVKTERWRRRIAVEDINSLKLGDSSYQTLFLRSIEGSPAVLSKELKPGLYHGIFKEIICLCDNSYRMVEAYIVEGDGFQILRKKAFQDAFIKDSDFSNFPYLSDSIPTFSGFPELYRVKEVIE